MNLQSEKTIRFSRNALNSHIMAEAVKSGTKKSAATLVIAKRVGVDRKSLKDFVEGDVAKPSKRVMQKYADWLGKNPETTIDPRDETPDAKSDLLKRIEVLEKENNELANANSRYKTENHSLRDFNKEEKLRLDRDYLGPSADNFYFIENMGAGIDCFTHNEDGEERKNLFTIPFVGFSEDDRHLLFELMDALAKCYDATPWWEDGEGRSLGLKVVFTDTHLGEWHPARSLPKPAPAPED